MINYLMSELASEVSKKHSETLDNWLIDVFGSKENVVDQSKLYDIQVMRKDANHEVYSLVRKSDNYVLSSYGIVTEINGML